MKILILTIILPLAAHAMFDRAHVGAYVYDVDSGVPVEGVHVIGGFENNPNPFAWTGEDEPVTKEQYTDANGFCWFSGRTKCGVAGCWVDEVPENYYIPLIGGKVKYSSKSLLGLWQPENLVVTIKLQKVVHPIPLIVKEVLIGDGEALPGFDGTNNVLKFDFFKGDWLPPHGRGEVADFVLTSKLTITGRKYKPSIDPLLQWIYYYNIDTDISFCGEHNGIKLAKTDQMMGIKIRTADSDGYERGISYAEGYRQKKNRFPNEWEGEYYSSYPHVDAANRYYEFRIRSRVNDKGELVEAYYGKIYRGFITDAGWKRGLCHVKFFYYLNPQSLDRNLEWDMKNVINPDLSVRKFRRGWEFDPQP
jgi:hypothetical protein